MCTTGADDCKTANASVDDCIGDCFDCVELRWMFARPQLGIGLTAVEFQVPRFPPMSRMSNVGLFE
jgi:hypothetical protein